MGKNWNGRVPQSEVTFPDTDHWMVPSKGLCQSGLQEWLGCLHEKSVLNYFCVCQTGSRFLMLSSHFFLSLLLHLMSRKKTFIKSFRLCDPAIPKELNYWLDLPFLECRVREPHFSSLNDIFWVWFYDSFYIFQLMSFFSYLLNLILLLLYVFVFWLRGMCDPSSSTRDWICTLCIGRQCFNHWTTREVPNPCCWPLIWLEFDHWLNLSMNSGFARIILNVSLILYSVSSAIILSLPMSFLYENLP